MTYLVEMRVGGTDEAPQLVKVEVEPRADGVVPAGRRGDVAEKAARSFGEMLAMIRPTAERLVEAFGGIDDAPAQIAVEFGLSLSTQADVIICSATAQVTFKVTLSWSEPRTSTPAPDASQVAAGRR